MTTIFLAEDDADDRLFFEDAIKVASMQAELTYSKNWIGVDEQS